MHHSMLPLIISCTRSWNFVWHLLWCSTTDSKNIFKLLAISQTTHTMCCEDNYFLLPICLLCDICELYVTKIKFMLCCDTVCGRHSLHLACLLGLFTFAHIACLLQLWIKKKQTQLLYTFGWRLNKIILFWTHWTLILCSGLSVVWIDFVLILDIHSRRSMGLLAFLLFGLKRGENQPGSLETFKTIFHPFSFS